MPPGGRFEPKLWYLQMRTKLICPQSENRLHKHLKTSPELDVERTCILMTSLLINYSTTKASNPQTSLNFKFHLSQIYCFRIIAIKDRRTDQWLKLVFIDFWGKGTDIDESFLCEIHKYIKLTIQIQNNLHIKDIRFV